MTATLSATTCTCPADALGPWDCMEQLLAWAAEVTP